MIHKRIIRYTELHQNENSLHFKTHGYEMKSQATD